MKDLNEEKPEKPGIITVQGKKDLEKLVRVASVAIPVVFTGSVALFGIAYIMTLMADIDAPQRRQPEISTYEKFMLPFRYGQIQMKILETYKDSSDEWIKWKIQDSIHAYIKSLE